MVSHAGDLTDMQVYNIICPDDLSGLWRSLMNSFALRLKYKALCYLLGGVMEWSIGVAFWRVFWNV